MHSVLIHRSVLAENHLESLDLETSEVEGYPDGVRTGRPLHLALRLAIANGFLEDVDP